MNREQRQPDLALQDALTYACEVGRHQGGWPLIHPRLLCIKTPEPTVRTGLHLNGEGLRGLERDAIRIALHDANGSAVLAARRLKIKRSTMYDKIKRLGIFAPLILLLAGCAVTPVQWSPVPPPTTKIPVALNPPSPKTIRSEGMAVAPPAKPFVLSWTNPNPPEIARYCLTEFHSTTNLLAPFTLKVYVPAGTNSWAFPKTQPQEFFICRFAQTNVTPWLRTEWNQ